MVITEQELQDNLDGSLLAGAMKIKSDLDDVRHHPVESRFVSMGNTILHAYIHPTELYGMGLSAEGFLDELDEEQETIYNSLATWARAASKFVNEREMLAVYAVEGQA